MVSSVRKGGEDWSKKQMGSCCKKMRGYVEIVQADRNLFAGKTKPVITAFGDEVAGQDIIGQVLAIRD